MPPEFISFFCGRIRQWDNFPRHKLVPSIYKQSRSMSFSDKPSGVPAVRGIQTFFRMLMGAFILYAGITHLTISRFEFQAQVPKWLPMNEDLVVILSGIVEITLGSCLLMLRKYRVQMGWIMALFFVLVFPGNISQYTNHIDAFGLSSDRSRLIRLFFQPVLIAWALWSTGAWQSWREKRKAKN